MSDQIEDCILQLGQRNQDLELYKLNFFIDSDSHENYSEIRQTLLNIVSASFLPTLLVSVIAQPPLTSKILVEAFFYDQSEWVCENQQNELGNSKLFTGKNSEFLIGTLQANHKQNAVINAEIAFKALKTNLSSLQFPVNSIIRQWNYIEKIIATDGIHQSYQDFNDVRSIFYADHFKQFGYPAATGIGMNQGGLIIEYIAMKSDVSITASVDNKQQVAAHQYSNDVLKGGHEVKTTPKFERARFLSCDDHDMMFISGTASILGEETMGINDPGKQTEISIKNIRELYSDTILNDLKLHNKTAQYGHVRVYVKNESDFSDIRTVCRKFYGDLSMVFIKADICRDNLLVEIEGEVILS